MFQYNNHKKKSKKQMYKFPSENVVVSCLVLVKGQIRRFSEAPQSEGSFSEHTAIRPKSYQTRFLCRAVFCWTSQ